MKYLLLFLTCTITATLPAQSVRNNYDAVELLRKVENKLNSLEIVSYDFVRETRYLSENYQHTLKASMYIDKGASPFRFVAKDERGEYVFNGQMTMRLGKDMTIDTATVRTVKDLDNNSYLYHSFAMLRNIIPLAITTDSMQKKAYDTMINGRELYCIEMEGPQMYFGIFNGISRFTKTDLKRPYYLVVDKITFIPEQFSTGYIRGADNRDFVKVFYSNINTHPDKMPAGIWNYSNYATAYKPYVKPTGKPRIIAGTVIKDFRLPAYTPGKTDTVRFAKYAGKIILLDFWFKSCGYCMEAMPHYKALQNKMGKDFQLITVNIEDGIDDMRFFYNKYKPNYPMLFNGRKLFESFGLIGCPSSLLIDRSGKMTALYEGFSTAAIEAAIKAL